MPWPAGPCKCLSAAGLGCSRCGALGHGLDVGRCLSPAAWRIFELFSKGFLALLPITHPQIFNKHLIQAEVDEEERVSQRIAELAAMGRKAAGEKRPSKRPDRCVC